MTLTQYHLSFSLPTTFLLIWHLHLLPASQMLPGLLLIAIHFSQRKAGHKCAWDFLRCPLGLINHKDNTLYTQSPTRVMGYILRVKRETLWPEKLCSEHLCICHPDPIKCYSRFTMNRRSILSSMCTRKWLSFSPGTQIHWYKAWSTFLLKFTPQRFLWLFWWINKDVGYKP